METQTDRKGELMIELNQIYNQDCLEGMKEIPDGSIDMILCDLPYGITACAWDKVIPFEPLWEHYKRVIKSNGAIVLTASQPFTTDLINSNRKWFKQELIWEKDIATGILYANRRIMKIHENILIFGKSATAYNPQYEKGEPYKTTSKGCSKSFSRDDKVLIGGKVTISNGTRYPKSVLKINTDRALHPTQKPVAVFGDFISVNCDSFPNEMLDRLTADYETVEVDHD